MLSARKGHFQLESGHHGDVWLDLERLCLQPKPVQHLAEELASRLAGYEIEIVCGPLVEGAFLALMVASVLDLPFAYSERVALQADALYPFQYRVPSVLRGEVKGRRVAIVNDVINAGSAVRGTFTDLKSCGAEPVVMGVLAILGNMASQFAEERKMALESLAVLPNVIWTPSECPLCARGAPLTGAAR